MIQTILEQETFTHEDIVALLSIENEHDLNLLMKKALEVKKQFLGNKVHYRGLVEFSNVCEKDCYYCGIRKSKEDVERFMMDEDMVIESAMWAYKSGYGSITLQSGERQDSYFIDFVERVLKRLQASCNHELGITLCLGEQTKEVYQRWFDAGATRYLLRIETTDADLYKTIHPQDGNHQLEVRQACLKSLREVGYQVGTGVMIGLPNQTIESLANEVQFFKDYDIDMIGMGPYLVSHGTPLVDTLDLTEFDSLKGKMNRFELGLKMIAVCRLVLKDVNIAATTALQAIHALGREKGIDAGANILMPIITHEDHRAQYLLYDQKPCVDDTAEQCKSCLNRRVESVEQEVGYFEKGDSRHYHERIKS